MALPIAHAGHFLAAAPFVMPCFVIVAWLAIQARIDRRRGGGSR